MSNNSSESQDQLELPVTDVTKRTQPLIIAGERKARLQRPETKIQPPLSKTTDREVSPYKIPTRQSFKASQRSVQGTPKPVRPTSLPKFQEKIIIPPRTMKKFTVVDLSSIQAPAQKPLATEATSDAKRNISPHIKASQQRLGQRMNNIFAIRKIGNFTFREIRLKDFLAQTSSQSNRSTQVATPEFEAQQEVIAAEQAMPNTYLDLNLERMSERRKSFQFDQEIHLRSILKKSHDGSSALDNRSKSRDSERQSSSVKSVHFTFC